MSSSFEGDGFLCIINTVISFTDTDRWFTESHGQALYKKKGNTK